MLRSIIEAIRQPARPTAALAPSVSHTFAELAATYLTAAEPRLGPAWFRNCRRLLAQEILPKLGDLRADKITRRDVAAMLEGIADRPGTANQVLCISRNVFREAIETGRLEGTNPAAGVRRKSLKSRDRWLTDAEIAAVWQASLNMEDHGRIVRLLLLTGQRRQEIGSLKWDEIHLEGQHAPFIELPAFRSKNRKPHRVPLTPLALAQLRPRRPGTPFVFGRSRSGFTGWSASKAVLDGKIGGMPPWCIHDLRRTAATHMNEKSLTLPHIVEAVLNHVSGHQGRTAGIYNRATYVVEKREALERWALEVQRIANVP